MAFLSRQYNNSNGKIADKFTYYFDSFSKKVDVSSSVSGLMLFLLLSLPSDQNKNQMIRIFFFFWTHVRPHAYVLRVIVLYFKGDNSSNKVFVLFFFV